MQSILASRAKEIGLPTESGDLLAVLDELDLDTLANGGVGLLGLNTDLLEDDTLSVRGTTERRGLEGGSEKALLVVQVGPLVVTAVVGQLARGVQTTGLSFTHLGVLWSKSVNCNRRISLEIVDNSLWDWRRGPGLRISCRFSRK